MVQANTQGSDGIGNINNLVCPVCRQHLVKCEGKCDCEYICINADCRGLDMEFPSYYGYTQEDIDGNLKEKEKSKEQIYCIWGSCRKFDPKHPELCVDHDKAIVVGMPVADMSLEEAKKEYPDIKFCEDWESEK